MNLSLRRSSRHHSMLFRFSLNPKSNPQTDLKPHGPLLRFDHIHLAALFHVFIHGGAWSLFRKGTRADVTTLPPLSLQKIDVHISKEKIVVESEQKGVVPRVDNKLTASCVGLSSSRDLFKWVVQRRVFGFETSATERGTDPRVRSLPKLSRLRRRPWKRRNPAGKQRPKETVKT